MKRHSPFARAPLASVLIAPALLALAGCGSGPEEPGAGESEASQAATAQPAPQSTEWTIQDPTKPAVPVDLPDTPMRNVPDAGASAPAPASPAPK